MERANRERPAFGFRSAVAVGMGVVLAALFVPDTGRAEGERRWHKVKHASEIDSLALDPHDPDRLYASNYGGFYYSNDGGRRWRYHEYCTCGESPPRNLTPAPSNPDIIYATADHEGGSSEYACLLRTIDGGKKWKEVSDDFSYSSYYALAVDPEDSEKLIVASDWGLTISQDGGSTFSLVARDQPLNSIVFDPQDSRVVYAGGFGGVLKSEDGGFNWRRSSHGMPFDTASLTVRQLAIDPLSHLLLYAATSHGLFETSDGGENWGPIVDELPLTEFALVTVTPSAPQIVYAVTAKGTIYKSVRSGRSWDPLPFTGGSADDDTDAPIGTLLVDPRDPTHLYATVSGLGIYRSDDGGLNWELPGGFNDPYTSVWDVMPDPSGRGYLYVEIDGSLFLSRDGGHTWALRQRGLPAEFWGLMISPSQPGVMYVMARRYLYRSNDWGELWRPTNVAATKEIMNCAIDPRNQDHLLVAAGDGIHETMDGGREWRRIHNGWSGHQVSALEFDARGERIYAIESDDYEDAARIHVSLNGGRNWRRVWRLTEADTGWPVRMLVDPRDPNAVILVSEDGAIRIRVDEDRPHPFGPRSERTYQIAFDPEDSRVIYAATSSRKLYCTRDGGDVWQDISTEWGGMPSWIYRMVIDPRNRVLYANASRGLFARPLDPIERMVGRLCWR